MESKYNYKIYDYSVTCEKKEKHYVRKFVTDEEYSELTKVGLNEDMIVNLLYEQLKEDYCKNFAINLDNPNHMFKFAIIFNSLNYKKYEFGIKKLLRVTYGINS